MPDPGGPGTVGIILTVVTAAATATATGLVTAAAAAAAAAAAVVIVAANRLGSSHQAVDALLDHRDLRVRELVVQLLLDLVLDVEHGRADVAPQLVESGGGDALIRSQTDIFLRSRKFAEKSII